MNYDLTLFLAGFIITYMLIKNFTLRSQNTKQIMLLLAMKTTNIM